MDTLRICQQCRKPLPENAPEGLCPECLARVALGSEPAAPGGRIPPEPAELAAQFPQFEIIELLGMGGMGMVYKARQPRLDRLVALKILPVDTTQGASFAERFEREAKALAKLNHPGIVTLYDFGQTRDYYYFIMEYVDGANLRQLIQSKKLEPRQALDIVTQICAALQFAHDEKIVHRDIKPENILVAKKGQAKIADFGLAKLLGGQPDTALTASQMVMGTLNYMAPEQREKPSEVDHRADIYSLGVVFYEMLTGEVPMGRFEAPSKKVQVDVRLDEVVLRALEREPARRYQQASEVKTGVETITASMPREKMASGTTKAFEPQSRPGFASYVPKRFAVFVLVWLSVGVCLRWVLGDTALSTDPHSSIPVRIISGIFIFCCGLMADLGMAKFLLPAILVLLVYAWLEAREKRGMSLRQMPPSVRRRLWLWNNTIGAGYAVVAMASLFLFSHNYFPFAGASVSMREYQNRSEEESEWWFIPYSGAYEKLGLRATFSPLGQDGKSDPESAPACSVSLIVHRKDTEPAIMKVILPGLRASYRFPATNTWDYTFILDQDSLVEWLHKGAGLDPTAPKFREEAGEIYGLLKEYQIQPPQTVKEFVNLAKADLRDFWFGGLQGGSFSFGGGSNTVRLVALLGGEALISLAFTLWATRRIYRAAWLEIAAGRWTPPKLPPPLPTTIKVLFWMLALCLVCMVLAGAHGEKDQQHAMLVASASLAIILVFALRRYSRQRIRQAREKGLWPQLGEVPTLEHVKGLAQAGDMILAMKLYRQIHPVSWLGAKAAVEKLAR